MCTCADDAMHYYMNCVCWRLRSFLVEERQHRTGQDVVGGDGIAC